MGLDTNVITYLACICFLFLFGRIFIVPVKKILKLVLNSIIGGIVIFIINFRKKNGSGAILKPFCICY